MFKTVAQFLCKRGTLGVPNSAILQEKLVNSKISCRKSTKYLIPRLDPLRFLKVASMQLV